MLSNRPYLLRAFYEWIVDSQCTPILVVDAMHPRCKIPQEYADDGEIVFNVSPTAVRDFKITNENVEFKASFSGVVHLVSAPIKAILAIYADENNEGLFFDSQDDEDDIGVDDGSGGESEQSNVEINNPTQSKTKPFLKLVE